MIRIGILDGIAVDDLLSPVLREMLQKYPHIEVVLFTFGYEEVAYLLLNYTRIGTYTYAIGSDEFVAKNMGINVNKYKVIAFIISGAFFGVEAVLTISYGSSMVAENGMLSMSRNFYPTMGCFLGMAMKKYGIPIQAIIIGEFFLQIIYYGFVALGAPTAVNDVISGLALLIIVTLTTKVGKGEIVK